MNENVAPRPNLFILGAAKSGTTSLHESLGSHPDVFMCEPKEPGYFVEELNYYPKSESWYRGIFADAGAAKIIGESSTHYSKLPIYSGVAERIAEYSPEARFIYIMRDPIDRAISNYWHRVRKFGESRSIADAITDMEYMALSDYKLQLTPYFEKFGRERVLLLTFEEMLRSPAETIESVFRWLEVDPALGTGTFAKENARPAVFDRVRGRGILHRASETRVWSSVSPLLPGRLKKALRKLSIRAAEVDDQEVQQVINRLRTQQREKVLELENFLGRSFREWTTVFPREC